MIEKILERFNDFIKKWTGSHYPHLIDSDENDGEEFRQLLRKTFEEQQELKDLCHICKHPKNSIGNKMCSYPHPVSRKVFEESNVRELDEKIKQLIQLINNGEMLKMFDVKDGKAVWNLTVFGIKDLALTIAKEI